MREASSVSTLAFSVLRRLVDRPRRLCRLPRCGQGGVQDRRQGRVPHLRGLRNYIHVHVSPKISQMWIRPVTRLPLYLQGERGVQRAAPGRGLHHGLSRGQGRPGVVLLRIPPGLRRTHRIVLDSLRGISHSQ